MIVVLVVVAGCTIERSAELSLGDFDTCPNNEKVFAVDPVSGQVLCEKDIDTIYEAGFGIDIADEGNPRLIELDIATLAQPGMPLGARYGLLVSGSAKTVDVTKGRARDAKNGSDIVLPTDGTLSLLAGGVRDFETGGGSPSADGWLYVYLVRLQNNNVGLFLSRSATEPATSLNAYRLLGALYWSATDDKIIPFRQTGGPQPMVFVDVGALDDPLVGDAADPGNPQNISLKDKVPPGTSLALLSVHIQVDGDLSLVDPVVGAEMPVASSLAESRTTVRAAVGIDDMNPGDGEVIQYLFASSSTSNPVNFYVIGYEWGPQETLEFE